MIALLLVALASPPGLAQEEPPEPEASETPEPAAEETPPAEEAPEAPPAEEAPPTGEIVPPILLKDVTPAYPPEARDQGLQGDVLVLITVLEDGTVGSTELLQGPHSLLNLSSLDAARQLLFEPATVDGQPVVVQLTYRFRFNLGLADEQGTPVPGSLYGAVVDPDGLEVPGVTVRVERLDGDFEPLVLTTRDDGVFKATFLPSGRYRITLSHPAFADAIDEVDVTAGENLRRTFSVLPVGAHEIVVTYDQQTWREVKRAPLEPNPGTVTGSYELTRRDIEATPGSMEDVARAVHALPGVVSDGDMLATFNVRGGETGDVVFMLDRVPLQNPFHLAGFNSLFNPDMISRVQFFAGAAPSEVPSATSAVLAVESWDGSPRQDARDIDGAIDVSASSLRILVMGPIGQRTSVALAARRSYLESYFQLVKWLRIIDTSFAAPEFSELSGRFAWNPTPEHRLMFTALRAGDSMGILPSESDEVLVNIDATFELENVLNLFALDHRWTPREDLRWQTTAAFTRDRSYQLRDIGGAYEQDVVSQRIYGRTDLALMPGKHEVLTGVDFGWTTIQDSGQVADTRADPTWNMGPISTYARTIIDLDEGLSYPTASAYVQETWSGPVRLRGGFRGTWTALTDEVLPSPSAGISVPLPTATVPKASWGLYWNIPQDPKVYDPDLGNPDLKAERAMHWVVGIDQGFPLPGEESGGLLRVEAYHIGLDRLVVNPDDPDVVASGGTYTNDGYGTNRGLDVMLGGRMGRWRGMATYSLLYTTRTNPLNTRFDQTFSPRQDQRHTLGTSLEFQLTPAWRLTARYSFHTGRPISKVAPTGVDDTVDFTCLNCERLSNFHNLDLRAEWRRAMKNYRLSVYIEVLNAPNFRSDFLPITTVNEEGGLDETMFYHLPVRPFLGVRADF
ncbi:MAG: TonB-dependent receptor [Alphaproteobacteria bacterium]|nr:TonB-dependent receptor [Alphaproteobacteria bacterium]